MYCEKQYQKVKLCYNALRFGTVIVLVSLGIGFVNTPRLYSDRATRRERYPIWPKVCARGSPKCLDFTRNTPQLKVSGLHKKHTATQPVMPETRLEPLNVCLTDRRLNQLS